MELAKVSGEIMTSIYQVADYPALFVHLDIRSPIIGPLPLFPFITPRFCVTLEAHAVYGILRSRVMAAHKVLHRHYTTMT
jgi:hypothetical protein